MKKSQSLEAHKDDYYRVFGKQLINWSLYQRKGTNVIKLSLIIDDINQDSAEWAYKKLFERHESLRTTFQLKDNEVVQKLNDYSSHRYQLHRYDLSSKKSFGRMLELVDLQNTRIISNLEKGPLALGVLFVIGKECYFRFMVNHIVSDAFSVDLIKRELSILYMSHRLGNFTPLPAPKIQIKDFTEYQHKNYDTNIIKKYWGDKFRGVNKMVSYRKLYACYLKALLQNPLYYNHAFNKVTLNEKNYTRIINYSGGKVYHDFIYIELLDDLYRKTKALNATPYTILLSALNILFHQFYSQEKILLVLRVDGRADVETHDIIGNLTGAVFLMNDLDISMTFDDVVKVISDNFHNTSAYIVYDAKQLGNVPVLTGSHLCVNYLQGEGTLEPEKIEINQHSDRVSYFPLSVDFIKYKNFLSINWIYNPIIFRPNIINFIAYKYKALLKNLLINSDGKLEYIEGI